MGALNKWVLSLVINSETLRRVFSDAGREPNRRQGAMKEQILTTAVVFPLWETTKRTLSGGIGLEGLRKAVIHCEGQF